MATAMAAAVQEPAALPGQPVSLINPTSAMQTGLRMIRMRHAADEGNGNGNGNGGTGIGGGGHGGPPPNGK